MRVVCYVSGHGYGHATRIAQLVDTLLRALRPEDLQIRTKAPAWPFRTKAATLEVLEREIDSGIKERNMFEQDVNETVKECLRICDIAPRIISTEAEDLCGTGCRVIVGDIPYLIGPIAEELSRKSGRSVTSVAIGNFSWDYIYQEYASVHGMSHAIQQISAWYRKVDHMFHLPLGHKMTAFQHVIDTPFLCRKPETSRAETRRELRIPNEAAVVFVAGRHAFLPETAVRELTENNCTILTDAANNPGADIYALDDEWTKRRFCDVLQASDVVVSKLGYSVAAECIAARVSLIYPPRHNYNEYDLLKMGIKDVLPNLEIPQDEFNGGYWWPQVQKLLGKGSETKIVDLKGDEIIAEAVLQGLDN
jgi:L-arabinokinase